MVTGPPQEALPPFAAVESSVAQASLFWGCLVLSTLLPLQFAFLVFPKDDSPQLVQQVVQHPDDCLVPEPHRVAVLEALWCPLKERQGSPLAVVQKLA